jgi:gamma-glutamyl hercynylcysteine S-oxide synthase
MSQSPQRHLQTSIIVLLCLLNLGLGYYGNQAPLMGGGAVGICYVLSMTTGPHGPSPRERSASPAVAAVAAPTVRPPADPSDRNDPVKRTIGQARYVVLLRKQMVGYLSEEDFRLALDAFRQGMAFVPEGDVAVSAGMECITDDASADPADRALSGALVHVGPFFLDRAPVTNREYYEFVAGGGYRDMALWGTSIWPAVLDMVDQTGEPGPRFWKNGCPPAGEEELPVVGISWYEAAACARWLSKRLPTDAEWVKAASWPVALDARTLVHRRYPWGDAMDRTRANVWGSGPNRIVAVQEFSEGASVGGIYQLIGNIWEWTDGDFDARPSEGRLELPTPMKSIRGGAFDTYFDSQANAQFQSGENPLGRRHNIGFRCAVGMRDVVLDRPSSEASRHSEVAGEKPAEAAT